MIKYKIAARNRCIMSLGGNLYGETETGGRKPMYAIVKTGGKQYKAEPGRFIDVEKLDAEVGAEVSFDALMVVDGDSCTVGSPVVDGVKVTGKVIGQDKQKKVITYKYKNKVRYRKKQGHRQPYTRVEIVSIG